MLRVGTAKSRSGIGGSFRLVALIPSVLAAIACSTTDAPTTDRPAGPVTLTIGYTHETGQNPLHGMQAAARLISFEGLVLPGRDGRVQPRLAEAWKESADGLTWNIKLRSDAVFHDGTPVDAAAVKASLERSLRTSDRDLAPGLADIVMIETLGFHGVLIKLRARSSFLLDDLAVAIAKPGPNGPIGAGPFVTSSTSDSEVVMTAVPKYYRGRPVTDRIVLKAYPAVRTAWAAMMRGEIDFLYEVSPDTLEFIESETSIQVFPFLRHYVYAVVFNSNRPVFKDWQVRQALNYAVDRVGLVEHALRGKGMPANGPAWPLHWAYDSSVPQFAYDPSRASALLDAANVPKVSMRPDPGKVPGRLHFTCLLPENFALWERMALIVQRDLSGIGVDMQIEGVSFSAFNKRIAEGTFDAVIIEMIAGNSVSRPYFFWHSGSRINTWGYRNPNVDRALDGIRRASNESEYRSAFRRFQMENIDDPPAIFLALGNGTRAVNKRFQVVAPPGSDILPTIGDWRPADTAARTSN